MREQEIFTGFKEFSLDSTAPMPLPDERPTTYADRVGEWYIASRSQEYRKKYGLYLTAVPVAEFMAKQIVVSGTNIRILDPAAGAGVLCCAAVEALATRKSKPQSIELLVYEVDTRLVGPLN